jgi:hypothetical protein
LLAREMLESLSPKRIHGVLAEVRQLGLAEAGPRWALRQREMAGLVKTLLPALRREMERGLG